MTWVELHRKSEDSAYQAERLQRLGQMQAAATLFAQAAKLEEAAVSQIGASQSRTLGIIALSAVALWFKAGEFRETERAALKFLSEHRLPEFSHDQIIDLLQHSWSRLKQQNSQISFIPGQIFVSVRGGEVAYGAAPLDLIMEKIETIRAALFRVIEFLQQAPFRTRGGPTRAMQELFRPWLLQAHPGSYQFAVALQEPRQSDLFRFEFDPALIMQKFIEIMSETTRGDTEPLRSIVPEENYRKNFLRLSQNLAPNGKSAQNISVFSADGQEKLKYEPIQREIIRASLKPYRTVRAGAENEKYTRGILRALNLDADWLSIQTDAGSLDIRDLSDAVDDVIGPMVNKSVLVRYYSRGSRNFFIDIELDD